MSIGADHSSAPGATFSRTNSRTSLPNLRRLSSRSRHHGPQFPTSPRHHGQEKVPHHQRPVDLNGHDWFLLQLQAPPCRAPHGHAQIRPHRSVSPSLTRVLCGSHSNIVFLSAKEGPLPRIEKESQVILLTLRRPTHRTTTSPRVAHAPISGRTGRIKRGLVTLTCYIWSLGYYYHRAGVAPVHKKLYNSSRSRIQCTILGKCFLIRLSQSVSAVRLSGGLSFGSDCAVSSFA